MTPTTYGSGGRTMGAVGAGRRASAASGGLRRPQPAEVRMRGPRDRQFILKEPVRQLDGHTGKIGRMVFAPGGRCSLPARTALCGYGIRGTGRERARFELGR